MKNDFPSYVVIEGPIGVGKTSLAKRFSETFGSELLLEAADENPFLNNFYDDPKSVALATQLFFLFQREKQMNDFRQNNLFSPIRVADFLIEKDRIFAELTLNDDEYALYDKVYQNLTFDVVNPDLVIYLQAPVKVLMERIRKRDRAYESAIDEDYLQRLCDAYTAFFYNYRKAPLLIVNAEDIDLVSNDHDYVNLLKEIRKIKTGRHYFNPVSFRL